MPSTHPPNSSIAIVLIALQALQCLFLWFHDWIPLGRLNDVAAVRREDSTARLAVITVIQSLPFTIGLYFSVLHYPNPYPHWLFNYLWISYGILFVGQLRAWWVPYLIHSEPNRAARFKRMFGSTHHFLPFHNGLVPNTAHILLHLATFCTLLLLFLP